MPKKGGFLSKMQRELCLNNAKINADKEVHYGQNDKNLKTQPN